MKALEKENRFYYMGLAMLAIVLHHLCIRCDYAWHVSTFPFEYFRHGNMGVDVFLFVSAYGCCASWEKNRPLQYMRNRLRRIYPQYILFLLITVAWFFHSEGWLQMGKDIICSMLGISTFYCIGAHVEWYVPTLLLMYLFLPLIKSCKPIWQGWIGTICMLTAFIICWFGKDQGIIHYLAFYRIPIILCGIYAWENRQDTGRLAITFALLSILAIALGPDMLTRSMAVPCLLMIASLIDQAHLIARQPITFIGKHSFEIFLAQTITTQFMMPTYFWHNKWLSLTIIIASTIAFSFLFALWEKAYKKIISLLIPKKS